MGEERTYRLALYARLKPRTPWTGGRTTDADVLTLEDAARFASVHVGKEITPGDFLRAAARGEIQLHARMHRSARFRAVADEPLVNGDGVVPARALVPLSLFACRGLAVGGMAEWRAVESLKLGRKKPPAWMYYDIWELEPDEPPMMTEPADCRVLGYDVHALADAFKLDVEKPSDAGASDEPGDAKREPTQADRERSPIGPPPLDTRTLADALDGIEGRRADDWRKLLGDTPQWAIPARVSPGERGRAAATWNPVAFAHALMARHTKKPQIAKLFRERAELEAWRDELSRSLSAFAEYGLD